MSSSRKANACWSRAHPAPARARWCARFPACGHGAAGRSTSSATRACSCCRSGPTCRPERCGAPSPIPGAAEDWDLETIAERLKRVGLGHLKDRIEEDAPWDQTLSGGEKQRLTVARVLPAPARHHRARRGDRRARSEEPGRADEAPCRGDGGPDDSQRRASARARTIPLAQADPRAARRRAAPKWSAIFCWSVRPVSRA